MPGKQISDEKLHLLFTGLGAGNIGDEAMLSGFVEHYPLPPSSTIEVYDPSSPIMKTLPPHFRYLDWKDDDNNRKAVKSAQAALLVGGTPVASEWGLEWPMRSLARRLQFCHSQGIPVRAVGVGVDALHDKEARKIFFDAFWPIESWTVRSPRCRAALLDLGVPQERITVGADLAWLFTPDPEDREWARHFWEDLGIDLSRPLIGINVVNERWPGPGEVKAAISGTLDRILSETDVQVSFLCNETRDGDYFDAGAAEEVAAMMHKDAVQVPNEYFTPSQMIALLSYCTITLSQRYHFTVLSILAKTASLSFGRGQKMISLTEELGEEPVGTMEACDAVLLEKRIKTALSDPFPIGNRQKLAAEQLKIRAENGLQAVRSLKPIAFPVLRLASVSELESSRFKNFMEMINENALSWGLRQFTDWSKIWEYPWLWFNGLSAMDWLNRRVLDLGSELSPMPWFLAGLGAQVTLAEKDTQWMPTWERLVKETGLDVKWRILPDEHLPFPERYFDCVTSFSVIEHQTDKLLAVAEVSRVLKPGGLFAISFDVCEPGMGMTFPEWNGKALTMKEFEELIWENPAFDNRGRPADWNVEDCSDFIKWHLQSAPHHNYVVGGAVLRKSK